MLPHAVAFINGNTVCSGHIEAPTNQRFCYQYMWIHCLPSREWWGYPFHTSPTRAPLGAVQPDLIRHSIENSLGGECYKKSCTVGYYIHVVASLKPTIFDCSVLSKVHVVLLLANLCSKGAT